MADTLHTWAQSNDLELCGVDWTAAPGETSWDLLLRVLRALARRSSAFEAVSGRLNVVSPDKPRSRSDAWNIDVDVAGIAALQARVAAAASSGIEWLPSSIDLRANAEVLLPDTATSVDVTDFASDEERDHAAPLSIVSVDDRGSIPPRLRCWRVLADPAWAEESAPVFCYITCMPDTTPPTMSMSVWSALELWSPQRFDGDGDATGGAESLEHLRRGVTVIATRTGGTLDIWPPE